MNNNEILKKIGTYMKLRNWSIYKLAKEADIPYSSLNSMFLKNTQPTIPTLEKICSGLNISMSDFFSDKSTENVPYLSLTEDEQELLSLYNKLSKSEKNFLSTMLEDFQNQIFLPMIPIKYFISYCFIDKQKRRCNIHLRF